MKRKARPMLTFAVGVGCFIVGVVGGLMLVDFMAEAVKPWDI